jgi:hypothetical protein
MQKLEKTSSYTYLGKYSIFLFRALCLTPRYVCTIVFISNYVYSLGTWVYLSWSDSFWHTILNVRTFCNYKSLLTWSTDSCLHLSVFSVVWGTYYNDSLKVNDVGWFITLQLYLTVSIGWDIILQIFFILVAAVSIKPGTLSMLNLYINH